MKKSVRKDIEDMTREELAQNWEKAEAQLNLLTRAEWTKFDSSGGIMWGLIERLVAEGVDLNTWQPDRSDHEHVREESDAENKQKNSWKKSTREVSIR